MKDFLKQKGSAFTTWLGAWCKSNVDFAFILAVFTETPRWTVTFMAIHEPLWIGIPLGVLLAFATTKVWKYYFTTRNKWSLGFNIAAIVLAMLVITPVLYAMMETTPHDVDVTVVLADWRAINPLRMAWAGGLALLTFVPLVQLAAVHGVQKPQVQILPDNGFSPAINYAVEQIAQKRVEDAQRGELVVYDDTLMDVKSRIADLQSEGFDAKWIATKELHEIAGAQLATLLNVDASTISRWRKAAKRNVAEVT